jgi:hypothetical protein
MTHELTQAIAMREMELWRDKIQLRIRDRIQTSVSSAPESFSQLGHVNCGSIITGGCRWNSSHVNVLRSTRRQARTQKGVNE